MIDDLRGAIRAVVRRIPRGRVATYGEVAALAGRPGASRLVGATMRHSAPADRLPWQRVVGSAGKGRAKINILDPIGGAVQRGLLEREGVSFDPRGRIALGDHGWLAAPRRPKTRTARRRRRAAR
jgi:methylated-DNA-protein-cysteine methyltransferase-like protein